VRWEKEGEAIARALLLLLLSVVVVVKERGGEQKLTCHGL
jgi:hypothetical protein